MIKAMIAGAAAAAALATGAHAAAPACDEACLKGFMDGYLAALVANAPGKVPVAANYKFTENGARIKLGEAMWVTFTGLGKYRNDFYDVKTGGVAAYVNMTENDQPGLLSVRLKVSRGKITEIETIVSRSNRNAARMETIDPSWLEVWARKEPPATRLTRQQLIDGAMNYMRSIAYHEGKRGNFHSDCLRVENGGITAIAPDGKPPVPLPAAQPNAPAGRPDFIRMGCEKQIDALFVSFIQGFEGAHLDLVDEERQVVFGTFDFMRRGNILSYNYEGKDYPIYAGAQFPNEALNSEAWKFADGKLYRVEAVFPPTQHYGLGNGWPGTKPELRPIDDTAGGRLTLRPVRGAKK